MERRNIWVVGGDRRQRELARLLALEGHSVQTFALGKEIPDTTPQDTLAGIDGADLVIFPLPITRTPGSLNAPLHPTPVALDGLLDCLSPRTLLFGGMIGSDCHASAARRGLLLRDYLAREELTNKNRLLSDYPGATGVKTGYTSKAGRCLAFGAMRDGMELVGVVLSCGDWFDEAARLMDSCFESYSMTRMLGPKISAGRIAVTDGETESCSLCVMEALDVPLRMGESAQVVLEVPDSVPAPVYPGMYLGRAKLVVDGTVYGEGEVVAGERVDADRMRIDVRRIFAHWML